MKKIFLAILLSLVLCPLSLAITGCGNSQGTPPVASEKISSDKKILIAYFSRTGEEYNVGYITKGNTAIIAEMIARKVDADIFEIKPAQAYPDDYHACTELAKTELESNARPALAVNISNLAQYDTIFLGYPIWWGALPRVVLTFLESDDFSGKKILPFCTHGSSGLAGTQREISAACPHAEVLKGLAIVGTTAQNDSADAENDVDVWLKASGY